jgi:hypothetical protein
VALRPSGRMRERTNVGGLLIISNRCIYTYRDSGKSFPVPCSALPSVARLELRCAEGPEGTLYLHDPNVQVLCERPAIRE